MNGVRVATQRTLAAILVGCLTLAAICERRKTAESLPPSYLPQGWQVMEPSTADAAIRTCANYSDNQWVVTSPNGLPEIRNQRKGHFDEPKLPPKLRLVNGMSGERHSVEVGRAWLLGFDAGEFGGGLWRTNSDGSDATRLLNENVQAIVTAGGRVLIFTGLAHMEVSEGKVYYVPQDEPDAKPAFLADLGAAPSAAIRVDDATVFVTTTAGVFRISPSTGTVASVFRKSIGTLYPTSMTILPDRSVMVGMRFFVLRLVSSGNAYKAEWLVPTECRTFQERELRCTCTAS